MKRSGFTLIELLVTMVVMAIVGTILARMLISDSRFVSRVEAEMAARQTARAAMHSLVTELRMISAGGLTLALDSAVGGRIPYAWGLACGRNGSNVVATIIPVDSMRYSVAAPAGFAWQDSTGAYNFHTGTVIPSTTPRAECTADSIRTLAGGFTVELEPAPALAPAEMPSGSIFYLYELLRFDFAPSVVMPGRRALWRTNEVSLVSEELLAPFDSTAAFRFVTDPNGPILTVPPGNLNSITGLDLLLVSESEVIPNGATRPETFELRTRVSFLNR